MQRTILEELYHTTLTISNLNKTVNRLDKEFYVLGTHSNLKAAKHFAIKALRTQSFQPNDFVFYEERRLGRF